MNRRSVLTFALVLVAGAIAPLYAQTPGCRRGWRDRQVVDHHRRLRAGLRGRPRRARAGRGVSAAAEAIARNPGAAGDIRGSLILGLVLIESLVIYVLLISLILFFLKPFSA